MKSATKSLLSMMLAFAVAFTFMPFGAADVFAAEDDAQDGQQTVYSEQSDTEAPAEEEAAAVQAEEASAETAAEETASEPAAEEPKAEGEEPAAEAATETAEEEAAEPVTEDMLSTSIGGISYYYADTTGDAEGTVYRATVKSRAGSTTYEFSKSDMTQVSGSEYYYTVVTGVTPLSGTLYGYGEGTASSYRRVYEGLGVSTDDSYDAITSATQFSGHHAKDIPSMVTYGEADGQKAITGLMLDREIKTVDAVTYVEASILKAAGAELSAEQSAALAVTLKNNPMSAPASAKIQPKVASAQWTTSKYGIGEFAIVPDDTVEGYVWSEYWGSVYAATISNGTDTVGAVHWIDLYGEAATTGPHYNKLEIALNNGESTGSNKATVNRYAKFFDSSNSLKPGKYTINVYAEGYETLTAEVSVPGYVLMNIPYSKFYEAEGVSGVDSVTSATVKTYNQNMAGGSYHAGYENTTDESGKVTGEILGVTYPVYVENMEDLEGLTAVTDDSAATITVASGKSTVTTKEVTGADLLFASGDYAYYVMAGVPANCKTLTVNEDGSFSFSAVRNAAEDKTSTSAKITYNGHYTPVTLSFAADEIKDDSVVTAIVIKADGQNYALRHVENVWRKTELGWYWTDFDGKGLAGKTITDITYYTKDGGVYHYAADLLVKQPAEGTAEAEFADAETVTVTGLPADIANPKAKVSSVVGRGQTPVVIAEDAAVTDGKIALAEKPADDTEYNVDITSDNYADISVRIKWWAVESAKDAVAKAEEKLAAATTDAEKLAAYEELADAYAALSVAMTQKIAEAMVVDISNYAVTLNGKDSYSAVYTGKAFTPAVAVSGVDAADYTVSYSDNIKAGTATVTVTATGAGYKGTITKKFTIAKAANGLTVKAAAKTVKFSAVKKKAQVLTMITASRQQGKVTYKKASGSAKLTVNASTGKITVKKGTKKGTYKAVISVTAAGDANHNASTKKVTVTVKVKK